MFLLAAEGGSFRRAAEESGRSPSAVSMQIRDLEEQLGISLFLRTPQRAILTPEGAALFERVKRAMSDVQEGLDRLKELADRRRGHVKIACVPTLASTRLPNILTTFKLRYPRSFVEVSEVAPAEGLVLLKNQDVEFYISPEVPNLHDYEFEPMLEDKLIACLPPEFDEGAATLSLSDLTGFPVILLDNKTAIRALIEKTLGEKHLSLNVQYSVQHALTALALADAGLGVAILPTIALLMRPVANYRVVPISDHGTARQVGIIRARGYVLHSYSEQLMAMIRLDLAATGLPVITPRLAAQA